MFKNYFMTAWRNLNKNRAYSFINIGGLAIGMSVAMVIGLWVWDELSFDKSHKNYDRIAQVWQFVKFGAEKSSYNSLPIPLAAELRDKYTDFAAVVINRWHLNQLFRRLFDPEHICSRLVNKDSRRISRVSC